MEPKQPAKDVPKQKGPSPQKVQVAKSKTAFCLRLNALRALACISVIITHIVGFHGLEQQFRSLHFGGHMAVYFFFSLSGYLLSASLVKEVRRRAYANQGKNETTEASDKEGRRLLQVEVHTGEINNARSLRDKISGLIRWLREVKKSTLVSILGKYLWNRTWRLFPMYYGCWLVLKYFATNKVGVHSLQPGIPWKGILLLQEFPGHLWTMRIEIIFYYTVIPFYVCALYTAFKWQKKGLKEASEAAFAGIVGALLYLGLYGMLAEDPIIHPVAQGESFALNLPPFCFGMVAGLVNFVLEQKFNERQAAAKTEKFNQIKDEKPANFPKRIAKRISEYTLSVLNKHKYSIVFSLCFLRIVLINPAFITVWTAKNEYPNWVMANLNCYWYAIFILINDSRGGFWKFMHPNPESQQTELRPAILHKMIYYFGLWSYPIYLTHPISYVTLSQHFPLTQYTLEVNVLAIFICLFLGGLCDLVFDKILVNKIILGTIIPGFGKLPQMFVSKKATPLPTFTKL